ncbi:glycosyltransferase [Sulfitobacter sp. SK011]|uniref:polysaccharide deacetylase family protein n=1 Tax=Sulfitobacter sp. SK011 TaxID=1389004 RepID=UPI000E0C115F|nr:glycosyltransferase [Sulfitobacter sp. SK011]AXI41071.1 glycosyl transferase [Sulfitobacter sp. SK011]
MSTHELEAALPDDLVHIKGQFTQTGSEKDRNAPSRIDGFTTAIETYHRQAAAEYRCLPTNGQAKMGAAAPVKQIYGFVPSTHSWSGDALEQSCDTIDVLVPEWYELGGGPQGLAMQDPNAEARATLLEDAARHPRQIEVLPVISFGETAAQLYLTAPGQAEINVSLARFFDRWNPANDVVGACLDVTNLSQQGTAAFASLLRQVGRSLKEQGLRTCIIMPWAADRRSFRIADRFADIIVAKAFAEPWIGSAPQPLAATDWFERQVEMLQTTVAPEKLVIALGTFTVDWVSGTPKPQTVPYAKAMSALAQAEKAPQFEPTVGNARAVFVDAKGFQHRLWMLDAVTMHNQLLLLTDRDVASIGVWGLGYEDPGIWAVLDQARKSQPLSADSLSNVVFSNYVERIGNGPFVSPISMPIVGQRDVSVDPQSNQIVSLSYPKMPQASVVRFYGQGQANKVVLTFDDGPDPAFTPKTLDILKSTDTPATFFVLGNNVLKSPELVERILAEGHELGSHTYSHPRMGDISAGRATIEINSVQQLVNGITGKEMRLYREPYMVSGGPVSSKQVASLLPLEKLGYVIAGMDIVPDDWVPQAPELLVRKIVAEVEENAGGIILLHDGGGDQTHMVKALPMVIETLRDKGYVFTSIADFLETSPQSLLHDTGGLNSTFQKLSFQAVGNSWSLLEIIFWSVLTIGLLRSVFLLILTAARQRHLPPNGHAPSVTIVIPAFNEADVIGACIENVLATEYSDFDVIIIDDGSTDGTYEAAMVFADHSLITVLKQPNRGKASAINAALFETDSDVLICIDADSHIHRRAVGYLAAHFKDPAIGAVAGRVVVGNRTNILTRLQALEYITAQSIERRAKEYLNAITVVPGAIGAWRTTALMEAGIFSTETLTEDADMTMAIIRTDYRVAYEERAIATTETPSTVKGLLAQRLRWSLGMMQAGWKHRGAMVEGRKLGLISLPDLAIFGYLMPLLAPLADLFLIILIYNFFSSSGLPTQGVPASASGSMLLAYLALPMFEVLTVALAFRMDPREDRRLMWLIPLQRIFYRQLLYYSVIRALWRAATGSLAKWGRANRLGFEFDHSRLT